MKAILNNKFNYSIFINFSLISIIFIYVLGLSENTNHESEIYLTNLFGGIIFFIIAANHAIFIKSTSKNELNKKVIFFRHAITIVMLTWLILMFTSKGAISLIEISPALFGYFMIELFHSLRLKMINKYPNLFQVQEVKYIALATIILSFIYALRQSYLYKIDLVDETFIIIFLINGIFASMIILNSYLILKLVIAKKNTRNFQQTELS
jgi:hypothetical protein